MTVGMNSAAIRSMTSYPAATAARNSLPEAPVISAATSVAGSIAMPGWVSMRKVSHLPPANIISALTKAAPALVSLVPWHNTVAAPPPPASSSCINASACRLAGMSRAISAELSACKVTPLARSTTSGGRSSYRRLATKAANSRLSDMMVSPSPKRLAPHQEDLLRSVGHPDPLRPEEIDPQHDVRIVQPDVRDDELGIADDLRSDLQLRKPMDAGAQLLGRGTVERYSLIPC